MTFTPSDRLKTSGASYIKYKLFLSDSKKLTGKFEIGHEQKVELNIEDKAALRTLDKKEFQISLKKKKFLFSKEVIDIKKFKLALLGQKCDMESEI